MAGSRPDFGKTFVGWQARSDGASRQQTAGWLNGASSKLRNFATHARRGGCTNTSAIRRVGAGDRAGFPPAQPLPPLNPTSPAPPLPPVPPAAFAVLLESLLGDVTALAAPWPAIGAWSAETICAVDA